MRIISWNINGIRAIAKKGFFDMLKGFDAELVCLQETKIRPDQLTFELEQIEGYNSYFNCAEKKGYSGTAVFFKNEPRRISSGLGDDRFDNEGRTIEIDLGDFILYNIYFPNGGQGPERLAYKLSFYACFLEKIKHQMKEGREIIVCGDVNTAHRPIDLANPAANAKVSGFLPEERAYIDLFTKAGLIDTFRAFYPDRENAYTWWSYKTFARDRNVGWRIDYFFATKGLMKKIKVSDILSDVMGSDHCPILLDIDL